MSYYVYNNEGAIVSIVHGPDLRTDNIPIPDGYHIAEGNGEGCRVDMTTLKLVPLPDKPIGHTKLSHVFDYKLLQWVDTRGYRDFRVAEYPTIASQLDMLYHAMKSGEIPIATEWFNKINEVKNKYPKEINNG